MSLVRRRGDMESSGFPRTRGDEPEPQNANA